MKHLCWLIFSFLITYVLLSLPNMPGFGIAIDFIQGISMFQRILTYVIEGLLYDVAGKSVISLIISVAVYSLKRKKWFN